MTNRDLKNFKRDIDMKADISSLEHDVRLILVTCMLTCLGIVTYLVLITRI